MNGTIHHWIKFHGKEREGGVGMNGPARPGVSYRSLQAPLTTPINSIESQLIPRNPN